MGNYIKYSTNAQTKALKIGNFWLGPQNDGKGPTSSTGYYTALPPDSGGFTIYVNKASGGPSIYKAANESQLVSITNKIGNQSFTTSGQCLTWYVTQTDKFCVNKTYEGIVTNGLVLNLDAGFTPSYPTSGTSWYDLGPSGNTSTLTNGPTFTSSNGGCVVLDGVDDYINCGSNLNLTGGFTCEIFVKFVTFNSSSGLFGQGPTITNQGLHLVYTTGSRGLVFGMYYNDADYGNNFRPSAGVWYHIVFTYDASNYAKNVYVDGKLLTPTSSTQNIYQGTGQLNIGATYSYAYDVANINISAARIYNRPLTNSEILQNYNAQKSRFGL